MSQATPTGTYVRQPGGYAAFVPSPLPPKLKIGAKLQALQSKADIAVGRLDGIVDIVPALDLFVFMYERREAVFSSQIEGTHASLMDVLEYEAQIEEITTRIDVKEILNYIEAMRYGLRRLTELPLSLRLLREIHGILMKSVRGGEPHKTPGEFRRSQNWIGGGSPATARFVPPPPDRLMECLGPFEDFMHDDSGVPPLIQIGLMHAQFETIHPFLDGNGRMGRLLITVWLVERRTLRAPLLYLAQFFKQNREEYMARLNAIRIDGAWEEWLEFFLDGVAQVATEATAQAREIVALRDADRDRVTRQLGRRISKGLALLDYLYQLPVVETKRVEEALKVTQPTASSLVARFVEIGILEEITGKQRNRMFAYRDYLNLFPGSKERD